MTLRRLKEIIDSICDEADETELNGHVIIRNIDRHGCELAYVSRTRTIDGKPDGYTYWGVCNIGWAPPKETPND